MASLAAVTALTVVPVVSLVVGPAAEAQPEKPRRCAPALSTGLAWDHVDPALMFMTPSVRWKNCRGVIRQVVLDLRRVNFDGGVADAYQRIYIPNLIKKANGRQGFHDRAGLVLTGSANTPGAVGFNGAISQFRSSVVLANGDATTALTGVTFYTLATAYDSRGREVLKKSSPIVACDQNG